MQPGILPGMLYCRHAGMPVRNVDAVTAGLQVHSFNTSYFCACKGAKALVKKGVCNETETNKWQQLVP